MLTSFTSFNFRIVSLSFISCSPAALPSISTSTSFFNSEALSPANLPASVLQGDAVSNIVRKKNQLRCGKFSHEPAFKVHNYILYQSMADDLRKTLENSCTAQVVPTILQEPLAQTNDTENNYVTCILQILTHVTNLDTLASSFHFSIECRKASFSLTVAFNSCL